MKGLVPHWTPSRPTSKGATGYHNAVSNTMWHKENIKGLVDLVKGKIKKDDIVVDFGAGTGSSSIYLLKLINENFSLLLVDNSPSWLGKAYEILHKNNHVYFFVLNRKGNHYLTLHELIGEHTINHCVSANTVHLIPDIQKTFKGIYSALKKSGTFTLQSGNISRSKRKKGVLMIDNTVSQVHDIALKMIQKDNAFIDYRDGLSKKVKEEKTQRKLIFPNPRPLEYYLKMLKLTGFKNISVSHKQIKVLYKDWLNFLRVKRLQAGILPEIGGKDATEKEIEDRDTLITKASLELFDKLKKENPYATNKSFTAEWVYIYAEK